MSLTQRAIDAMAFEGTHPKAQDIRWDDNLSGFGVRVWPSGAKTFLVRYRFLGRRRYLTLGPYGVLTLSQARDLARLRLAEVLTGVDPLEARRKAERGDTFADFAAEYLREHAKKRKDSWRDDEARLRDWVLPVLGPMKLDAITRQDVTALHRKIGSTPRSQGPRARRVREGAAARGAELALVGISKPDEMLTGTANRVLSLLSKMFSLAVKWGRLPDSFGNPATKVDRFPEKERERVLSKAEMPRLIKSLEAEGDVYLVALVWLYLLTGMRKSELRVMRWEWIDLEERMIKIPAEATKAEREHLMPLSAPAFKILSGLPRLKGNPFVFCGHRKGKPLNGVGSAWKRIRERAGLQDVWLHDLRRTLGSWLVRSGYSLELIGKALNHSNVSTTKRYARFDSDPVARAVEEHGAALIAASGVIDVEPSPPAPSAASRASLRSSGPHDS